MPESFKKCQWKTRPSAGAFVLSTVLEILTTPLRLGPNVVFVSLHFLCPLNFQLTLKFSYQAGTFFFRGFQ